MRGYKAKTPWWLKKAFPADFVWSIPNAPRPAVYLTFDDGPHPTITPFVLDLLDQHQAKATFFCVGDNVARYPDVYQDILRRGHTTANHTHNHLNGWKTTTDAYLANIDLAAQYIASTLFRPPYGKISPAQSRRLRRHHPGWQVVMWDVLSADFDTTITPEQCLGNVQRNIAPGSVVLFHDSDKAWQRMSYALPLVLQHCAQQDWQLMAVPQTLNHTD